MTCADAHTPDVAGHSVRADGVWVTMRCKICQADLQQRPVSNVRARILADRRRDFRFELIGAGYSPKSASGWGRVDRDPDAVCYKLRCTRTRKIRYAHGREIGFTILQRRSQWSAA